MTMHTRDFAKMSAEAFNVQVERHEALMWVGNLGGRENDRKKLLRFDSAIRQHEGRIYDPYAPHGIEHAIELRAMRNVRTRLINVMALKKR